MAPMRPRRATAGAPPEPRLRASLIDDTALVVERSPTEAAIEAGASAAATWPRPVVRALPRRAVDRAAGQTVYEVVVGGWRFEVSLEDAAHADLRERASRGSANGPRSGRLVVRAQIPGRVVSVRVQAGQTVEAGQRLLSVEAMKMENEIRAQRAGRVERVAVAPGQRVERGQELAVLV
jgi:biotin carboxyl carrier protein